MTEPILPDYSGANIRGLVPGILGTQAPGAVRPDWFPPSLRELPRVVLFVVDGLGWLQLQARRHLAPALASMSGSAITTVAPSTTSTALTSISTGRTPAEHGILGYRMDIGGEVVNMLRWWGSRGDARQRIPPRQLQPHRAFLGERVPVVSRADLSGSAFTEAHLYGVRHIGWRTPSNLVVEVNRLVSAGESFVYAYYDGLDKVAHEYGLGDHYDAELRSIDRLVADILASLPDDVVLCVTADHGQVHVGERIVSPGADVFAMTRHQSGEGRFRWLHARPGTAGALRDACSQHEALAWVVTREQVIDEGWFGPYMASDVARRLGDVALVAREPVSFDDPADSGPFALVCRHGSLTADEIYVPLLAGSRG